MPGIHRSLPTAFTTAGLTAGAAGLAAGAAAEPARYDLDPAHATIAFLVEHVGYAKTLGQFLRVSGGYTFDDELGTLSALRVVVDTGSVDTHHEARDRHLRSGDFLDSAAHPDMVFTAERAQRTGGAADNLVGDQVETIIEIEARRRRDEGTNP